MNRDELVERMLDSYWQDSRPCLKCTEGQHKAMDAALSVAVEELLGEPSEDEMIRTARQGVNWAFGKGLDYDRVRDIFANRRSKLERVKTPEERVRLSISAIGGWLIYLDGERKDFSFARCEDAEIYRLGLIAQLKSELPKNQ